MYHQGFSFEDIVKHTMLDTRYIGHLIECWEIEKGRGERKYKPAETMFDFAKPTEVSFVLLEGNKTVRDAYNAMINNKNTDIPL